MGTPINWNVLWALLLPCLEQTPWNFGETVVLVSHILKCKLQSSSHVVKLDLHKPRDVWIAVCDYTGKVDSDLSNQLDSQFTEYFLATSLYKWNASSEGYMFDKYQSWQGAKEYTSI